MSDYKPEVGDEVRITIQGKVTYVSDTWIRVDDNEFYLAGEVESIEKIEPPVEVFKAGDVVRAKGSPEYVYAVAKDGYLSLAPGDAGRFYGRDANYLHVSFTSKNYELVEVGA